jgi:hypothetical protein
MKFRFDEHDDLVVEDIPDDIMDETTRIALERGVAVEDIWRELISQLADGKGQGA